MGEERLLSETHCHMCEKHLDRSREVIQMNKGVRLLVLFVYENRRP